MYHIKQLKVAPSQWGCIDLKRDGYHIKHKYKGVVHYIWKIYSYISEEEFIWLDLFAVSELLFIVIPTLVNFFYVK